LQASANYRRRLREILTAEQYRTYKDLWDRRRDVYGRIQPKDAINGREGDVGSSLAAPTAPP
jgi:hypothetical protein